MCLFRFRSVGNNWVSLNPGTPAFAVEPGPAVYFLPVLCVTPTRTKCQRSQNEKREASVRDVVGDWSPAARPAAGLCWCARVSSVTKRTVLCFLECKGHRLQEMRRLRPWRSCRSRGDLRVPFREQSEQWGHLMENVYFLQIATILITRISQSMLTRRRPAQGVPCLVLSGQAQSQHDPVLDNQLWSN